MANALRSSMSSGNNLYRYAGEEFAALLLEQTSDTVDRAAERLRASIADLAVPHPSGDTVSVSIGVAAFSGHGVTAAELFAQAGQALCTAKAKGRNRVELGGRDQCSRLDGASARDPGPSPVEAE